jgi:hypothetical protein
VSAAWVNTTRVAEGARTYSSQTYASDVLHCASFQV